MARRQPQVSVGPRSADHVPERETRSHEHADELALQHADRPGKAPGRYFHSRHANLRVACWGVPDRYEGGMYIRGDNFTAEFQNGMFFVSADDPQFERKVKALEGKSTYGQHGLFWDEDLLAQRFREKQVAKMRAEVQTMLQDPDIAKLLRQDMEAAEFVTLGVNPGTAEGAPGPTAAE